MPCPGIGRRTATVYAQNGIQNLALASTSRTNLEKARAELNAQFPHVRVEIFVLDVSKEDQVKATVQAVAEKFGRIDIAVHGAAVPGVPGPTHESETADWQRLLDVNLTGVMLCEKYIIRQMLGQELRPGYEGRGMIVNISSIFGLTVPDGALGASAYAAAKHAMIGMTKMDAKTYAKDGIRINVICPGFVETPLTEGKLDMIPFEIEKAPLKRPAETEEIANAILFLTSRMGSFMCASVLVVDGGYTS
ncbi:hypothetical protein BJX61DRAFT_548956 [Aspergillus egyptiacus]|nr:hypothetical protein BJX61DRAFT_548956 [Aspergillus egyptiacus]